MSNSSSSRVRNPSQPQPSRGRGGGGHGRGRGRSGANKRGGRGRGNIHQCTGKERNSSLESHAGSSSENNHHHKQQTHRPQHVQQEGKSSSTPEKQTSLADANKKKKILVLHGNRQTGDLLLGRMEKLQKALCKEDNLGWEMVAPDAPHLFVDEGEGDCADSSSNSSGEEDISTDQNHSRDSLWQRTWWHRKQNSYVGLEDSLSMLHELWMQEIRGSGKESRFVAILGFSQGSRLAHLISVLHTLTNGRAFPGLQSIVHVSGYGDVPMADNFFTYVDHHWGDCVDSLGLSSLTVSGNTSSLASSHLSPGKDYLTIEIPSLHVMGEVDKLIPKKSSEALMELYFRPKQHVHPGGHHVPVKSRDIDAYIKFLQDHNSPEPSTLTSQPSEVDFSNVSKNVLLDSPFVSSEEENTIAETPASPANDHNSTTKTEKSSKTNDTGKIPPDEEHAQTQIDEVSALAQIFPSEFNLLSSYDKSENFDPEDFSEESRVYHHPIEYSILLQPLEDFDPAQNPNNSRMLWPPKPISLKIQYPPNYPDVFPLVSLIHDMNYLEFSMHQSQNLLSAMKEAMEEENGMPCVMGLVTAAREFFESGGMALAGPSGGDGKGASFGEEELNEQDDSFGYDASTSPSLVPSSSKRIEDCIAEGLRIARTMIGPIHSDIGDMGGQSIPITSMVKDSSSGGGNNKGGSWKYTIGLVGKPSAGKSTFFNAATAFARQRRERGGAHEREVSDGEESEGLVLFGAAMAPHPFTTIDPNVGYCLVPAPCGMCPEDDEESRATLQQRGLLLGSTHGRDSRGRRLIPASLKDVAGLVPGAYQGRGKGNKFLDDLTDADVLIHVVDASGLSDAEGNKSESNHPIKDLAWVRNELVEWVYFNISSKWNIICRRGKKKLLEMFSGYKQSQSFVVDVFVAVEKFMSENEGRDHSFDTLETWDEGDLHRLVSAFLGVRFPMALALNKNDLPTAQAYINDIKSQFPIHGALVGTGLSAYQEMKLMRHQIGLSLKQNPTNQPGSLLDKTGTFKQSFPNGVWDCLQLAMALRGPMIVFPVNDMQTYEPLHGISVNYATLDSSLPKKGMISCLTNSGGSAPTLWDCEKDIYTFSNGKNRSNVALRDAILMKPGSTVEDVFLTLKGLGALEGEFVRAEGASSVGEKPKLVPKSEIIRTHNRILRIMTTKRKEWQRKL